MKQFYQFPLRKSIAFGLLLCSTSFYAQISNNNNPDPSAVLDLNATNKGLLLPRVALTGTADVTTIPAPAKSLVVYNATAIAGMPEGFYYWNGTRWESLSNEAISHAFASAVNTLTSTVNGIPKTAEIINTNALSLTGTNLTSTVNGKASAAVNLASIVPATTNVLTSTTNTLTSIVNNVSKSAPIINTNALALSGTNLTSTVNGVASAALNLSGLAGWNLDGNAATTTDYIGTKATTNPLIIKTSSAATGAGATPTERMRIDKDGVVTIGNVAGSRLAFSTAPAATDANSRRIVLHLGANDNQYRGFGIYSNVLVSQVDATAANFLWRAGTNATTSNELMRLTGTGKLGLGNIAPTYSLDVVSTANDELLASFQPQNKTQGVAIGYSGISKIAATADSDFKISPKGNGKVNIDGPALIKTLPAGTVGEQVVVVDSNNNLKKIASASVGKTYTGGTGITVTGTVINAATTNALALTGTNLTSTVNGVTSNALSLATLAGWSLTGNAIGAAANFLGTTDNQPLRFRTNNTEKMTITAAGNVGIGNTAPNAPLQFSNAGVWRKIVLLEDANNDYQFTGFGASTGSFTHNVNALTSNYFWYAGASATTRNELMRLSGTGNLGIGGVTPTQKLHVAGKAIITTMDAGAAADQIVTVDAAGLLKKRTLASVVPPTTNALALTGTNLTSTVNGVTSNALSLATLAGWSLTGNAIGAAANFLGTTDNQPLRFRTNNTEKMTITAAGNVGIGNTAPNAPLQFASAVANRKVVLYDTTNNDNEFYGFGISSGMLRSHISSSTTAFGWFAGTSATANKELMRLAGTGKLGLGNAAPTYTLDVVSTTNDELLASFLPENKTQGVAIGYSGISKIASTANSDFKISPKGTGKVNIDGPALVKTLPAGAIGEQVVVVDGSNNLKKIAATSVGKTYTGSNGITVSGTNITAQTTTALWNANQLQGRAVATTAPATGQILRYNGSTWQPYTTATYSPTLVGTLGAGTPLPNTNAPVYTRAYITLPANSKYIITVNMLATSHPNRAPNDSSLWIRSWFSNSSTNSTMTGDRVGGGLVSGNVPGNSLFNMINGTVILHNNSGAAKTYYYWASTGDRFNNGNGINNFASNADSENQMFAVPIDN